MEHKVSAFRLSILSSHDCRWEVFKSTHGWKLGTLLLLLLLVLSPLLYAMLFVCCAVQRQRWHRIAWNAVIKSMACVYTEHYYEKQQCEMSFTLHSPYPWNASHCGHLMLALVAENLPCALIALTISSPRALTFLHPHAHTSQKMHAANIPTENAHLKRITTTKHILDCRMCFVVIR